MRLQVAALTLLMAASLPLSWAGERAHKVRSGESASSVAKRYYGSFEAGRLVLEYNGKTGTVIHAGEILRVPFCEIHRVVRGDSWSVLARRHLARASAWRTLAELNQRDADAALAVDDRLVMPVVLSHALERGDTLASLAEHYYGDAGRGELLRRFNRIDDPRRLAVGATIEVPLVSLQLARATAGRFGTLLSKAATAFDRGEYARARTLLESSGKRIRSEGDAQERAEFRRLLAFVYVAYDLPEDACGAWRLVAEPAVRLRLDTDLVSPKIRDVLSRCGSG